MRSLLLHCDYFEYTPVAREIKEAEPTEVGRPFRVEEVLVVLTSVEREDGPEIFENVVEEVGKVASQVRARRILLYPYAHLSNQLASPNRAKEVLISLEKVFEDRGFDVFRAPFGWTKAFSMKVKGHALAEQFKVFEGGKERKAPTPPKEKFHKFYIIDVDGREYKVTKEGWDKVPVFEKEGVKYEMLKVFVRNELVGKPPLKEEPRHIFYMRKLELVDYCPESDVGHMKWYPKGILVKDLMMDYAFSEVAMKWGAMKTQNPLIYRTDVEAIRLLQGEFHERDYVVEGDVPLVLRFASDPGAFPFVQKLVFSYKQMPLKIYEEAICFRKEQKGEVTGLMRVRNFWMTDHHAFCLNEEMAKEEYRKLCVLFKKLMDDIIAGEYWVLGFEIVEGFYERYREFLKELVREMGVPAFFKLMRRMTHYYAFKNEYQAIFPDGSNLQISTVQWDVKNGERFGIKYVDADGVKKPVPIILHASSFGSIERALAAILERAAWMEKKGYAPMLPFWLSPEQVRVIPVSVDRHYEKAKEVADILEREGYRVGLDDRELTLSKKVFEAKREWIPILVIIGDRELREGKVNVVSRIGAKVGKEAKKDETLEELLEELSALQGNMPRRPLYVPKEVGKRAEFTGLR
jgi:threonyl-tRNA synthetase